MTNSLQFANFGKFSENNNHGYACQNFLKHAHQLGVYAATIYTKFYVFMMCIVMWFNLRKTSTKVLPRAPVNFCVRGWRMTQHSLHIFMESLPTSQTV